MARFGKSSEPFDPELENELVALFGLTPLSVEYAVFEPQPVPLVRTTPDRGLSLSAVVPDTAGLAEMLRTIGRIGDVVGPSGVSDALLSLHARVVCCLIQDRDFDEAERVVSVAAPVLSPGGHTPYLFTFRRLQALIAIARRELEAANELLADAVPVNEDDEVNQPDLGDPFPASQLLSLAALLAARGESSASSDVLADGIAKARALGFEGEISAANLLERFSPAPERSG